MKNYEFAPGAEEVAKSLGKSPSEVRANVAKSARNFGQMTNLIPDEARYTDSMRGFDGRDGLRKAFSEATGVDFSKAMSISGLSAGTTDKSLIPLYVDPTIVDLTRRLTPLVELIPRVTNYGRTAEYNRLTARGVVGAAIEDAPLAEANDTYERKSTPIKYFYTVGRVTGPYLASSRQYLANQYIDALNLEVRNKTISLRYVEEDAIINGDATASRTAYGGVTTPAGAEYTGLLGLITTNSNAPIAGANTAITIPDLRKAIRLARTANNSSTLGQGDPNLIVTDFTTTDNIKSLLQDQQRYVNTNFEIAWGLKTMEFEGLPILPSKFIEPATSTNIRKLMVLSTDTLQMRVLQDVTYEELAKTNDSYKFMNKVYESLICTAEEFNSQIVTIHD